MTLREVAHAAGVSAPTVSRVLRGAQNYVSSETEERIRSAAARLGYRPHVAARLLASAKSHMVAVVSRGTVGIIRERVAAVRTELEGCGYQPIPVPDTISPAAVHPISDTLDTSIVQAVVVTVLPSEPLSAHLRQLVSAGAPVVSLLKIPTPGVPTTAVDTTAGAYMATRHLISLGHRRIAGVNITPTQSADKWAGYCKALEEHDLEPLCVPYVHVYEGAAYRVGYELAEDVLHMPERPTAAFCSNDEVAIGLIRAMHERSLRVPQDLSVVGFDGFEQSRYSIPALTTVRQPVQECARRAVQRLVEMMRGDEHGPLLEVLAPDLMIGESAAEPRS